MTEKISRKHLAEQLWLGYFNQILFQEGIITEQERNKMALKIQGYEALGRTK